MDTFSDEAAPTRAEMVDVGGKDVQLRVALASGRIALAEATVALIAARDIVKGDVLTAAELAGIQAAKRTPDLIPLCHPIPLTRARVKARLERDGIAVTSEIACVGRTGVEMEALTAVAAALLTVYDMCKAVDKAMVIEKIVLVDKQKKDLA